MRLNAQITVGALACLGLALLSGSASADWQKTAMLLASDGESWDEFGYTVALSGDDAAIGAWAEGEAGDYAGAAYIFRHDGVSWSEQQKLLSPNAAAFECFGACLVMDGGTLVVGAPSALGSPVLFNGSAYVYVLDNGLWVEQAQLVASDGAPEDYFGVQLAIDGDRVAVAATDHDDPAPNSGSVYIFERSGDAWTQQAKIPCPIFLPEVSFGWEVALDGDWLMISRHVTDDPDDMIVFAYELVDGTWVLQQELSPPDGTIARFFGARTALDENTILIMAFGEGGLLTGAVYAFEYDDGAWAFKQKLTSPDPIPSSSFGISVALEGNRAAIGSGAEGAGGCDGLQHIFVRQGGVWEQIEYLEGRNDANECLHLSGPADLEGGRLLVGSPGDDGAEPLSGIAIIFEDDTCIGDLDGDGDTDQADLGVLLASYNNDDGGDLNGDGFTDQADLGILLADYGC